jgi:hypothetical protein
MFKSSRKKLIAIGCSFTEHYLQDLMRRPTQVSPDFDYNFPRWSQHLAEKLDMDCLNLGRCGMGNEYISAKLIDTILAEKKEDIGLVVLMWSGWQRMDYLDIEGEWKSVNRRGDDENIILKYNNAHNATMKSIRYFLMSQMLLKDIPYLMIQGVGALGGKRIKAWGWVGRIDPHKDIWIQTFLNSKIFDEIDEKKFIGWPIMDNLGGYNVNNILDKLDPERNQLRISDEDHHPNREGHKIIAQEIYNEYEKIYI